MPWVKGTKDCRVLLPEQNSTQSFHRLIPFDLNNVSRKAGLIVLSANKEMWSGMSNNLSTVTVLGSGETHTSWHLIWWFPAAGIVRFHEATLKDAGESLSSEKSKKSLRVSHLPLSPLSTRASNLRTYQVQHNGEMGLFQFWVCSLPKKFSSNYPLMAK